MYFYSDGITYNDWCKNPELTTARRDEGTHTGEYRLRKYEHPEIPVYDFGFWTDEPKLRPGHGGEWSSNSEAINKVFGTNLLEIALDQLSVAAPIDWIKEKIGDAVVWEEADIWGHIITEVKGVEKSDSKWIEIPLK
jgi:hypothetical protein